MLNQTNSKIQNQDKLETLNIQKSDKIGILDIELSKLIYENTPESNDKLRKCVALRKDLNILRASDNNPLLHYALLQQNYEACVILLENNVYIEELGNEGIAFANSPLKVATTIPDPRFMDLLIQYKANINEREYQQQETPLAFAINYCQFENAKRLIKYGANVNLCDYNGQSAIFRAIEIGNPQMVYDLIENGANIEIQDKKGQNLLHYNMIESNFKQYKVDDSLYVPGDEITEMLIYYGCYTDIPDESGKRPLHYAIQHCRKKSAKMLILNDVDVNAQDEYLFTPLHLSVYNKDISSTALLLSHKANPNLQDKFGNTPLHYAAQINSLPLIRLLLKFGAVQTIENHDYLTPLDLTTNQQSIDLLAFPMYGQDFETLYQKASEDKKKIAFKHYLTAQHYQKMNHRNKE